MKSTRIIAMALLAFMLLSMLISCGGNSSNTGDGGTVTLPQGDEVPTLPTEGFNDAEFTILVSGHEIITNNAFNDFAFEETNPDELDAQIKKRNLQVEKLLGVKIKTVEDFKSAPEAKKLIEMNHMSGDNLYDAVLPIAYDVSKLAYDNKLSDLNTLSQYLDLSHSWWDQKANEDLELNNIMFYTTGNFAVWANEVTSCVAFNKTLANDWLSEDGTGASNIYTLASEGKWTYDELIKAAKICHSDDGSTTPSIGDTFGLITWDDAIYSVVNSIGTRCCTINDQGKIELTLYNESTSKIIKDYIELCKISDTVVNFSNTPLGDDEDVILKTFGDNKALFLMIMFKNLAKFRDLDVKFGIIPYPKFDAEQDRYYSTIAPWHVNYLAVPAKIANADMSGAVLEALCYYSTDTVREAYYDKTLNGKIVQDEESAPMLDIIFSSRIFDVGYYYQPNNINKVLITKIARPLSTDFASVYEEKKDGAITQVNNINKFFEETFKAMGK